MGILRLKKLFDSDVKVTDYCRESLSKTEHKKLLIDLLNFIFHLVDVSTVPQDFQYIAEKDLSCWTRQDVIESLQHYGFRLNQEPVGPELHQLTRLPWEIFEDDVLRLRCQASESEAEEFRSFCIDNHIDSIYRSITDTYYLSFVQEFTANLDISWTPMITEVLSRGKLFFSGYILSGKQLRRSLIAKYEDMRDRQMILPSLTANRLLVYLFDIDNVTALVRSEDFDEGNNLTLLSGQLFPEDCVDHCGNSLAGYKRAIPLVLENTSSRAMDRRYGGTYDEAAAMLLHEIRNLQSMGFELHFFTDSKPGLESGIAFKSATIQRRKRDEDDSWWKLRDVIQYEVSVVEQEKLPLPPLMIQYLSDYLKNNAEDLRIFMEETPNYYYEADHAIHVYCLDLKTQGYDNYFVYSYDTDFEIMEHCPLINPGWMDFSSDRDIFTAVVRRNEKTCQFLGVTNEILLEFALIMGCDFTKQIELEALQFGEVKDLTNKTESELLELLKQEKVRSPEAIVKAKPDYFDHDSEANVCDLHLDFARAFYRCDKENIRLLQRRLHDAVEHLEVDRRDRFRRAFTVDGVSIEGNGEDIDENPAVVGDGEEPFCEEYAYGANNDEDDEDDEDEKSDEDDEADDLIKLSFGCTECIHDWISVRGDKPRDAGALFLSEHLNYRGGYLSIGREETFYDESNVEDRIVMTFEEKHMLALQQMLEFLSTPKLAPIMLPSDMYIRWEDYQAGYLYQLIIREMDLQRYYALPSLFNGKIFHYFCHSYDQQHESKEATPVCDLELDSTLKCQLPVHLYHGEICQSLRENDITMIAGSTGCGKSSIAPLMAFYDHPRNKRPKILLIEPRRVVAKELYDRYCNIFYSIPPEIECNARLSDQMRQYAPNIELRLGHTTPRCSNPSSGMVDIVIATAGYVMAKYFRDKYSSAFNGFTHIILDEMHERSMDYDMIMYFLKHFIPQNSGARPKPKFVFMSATPVFSSYEEYFVGYSTRTVIIEGSIHSLTKYFLDSPQFLLNTRDMPMTFKDACSNIIRHSEQCIVQGQNTVGPYFFKQQIEAILYLLEFRCIDAVAGVLIFVSGLAQIQELQKRIMKRFGRAIIVKIAHSSEENISIQAVQDENNANPPLRVVIATNILESSVTITDIEVVMCCGTQNISEYDPNNPSRTFLLNSWISKPSADQRAGRTGRVGSGVVYRLYSESLYRTFPDKMRAELNSVPLPEISLKVIDWTVGRDKWSSDIRAFNIHEIFERLPEPFLDREKIDSSIQNLEKLQLITSKISTIGHKKMIAFKLTIMGKFCNQISMNNLSLARMMYFGVLLGLVKECALIASMVSHDITPFRNLSATIQYNNPDFHNQHIRGMFNGKLRLDESRYSDPMLVCTFIAKYTLINYRDKAARNKFIERYMAAHANVDRLINSAQQIVYHTNRCSQILNNDNVDKEVVVENRHFTLRELDSNRTTLLRIILTWTCSGNVLRCTAAESANSIAFEDIADMRPEKFEELFDYSIPRRIENVVRYAVDVELAKSNTSTPISFVQSFTSKILLCDDAIDGVGKLVEVVGMWIVGDEGQQLVKICCSFHREDLVNKLKIVLNEDAVYRDGLAEWSKPSTLWDHIQLRSILYDFTSAAEIYLPTPESLKWKMILRQCSVERAQQCLRECADSHGIFCTSSFYEITGFAGRDQHVDMSACSRITFLDDTEQTMLLDSDNPNQHIMIDDSRGNRLKNAYCSQRGSIVIGSWDNFNIALNTQFESMQGIRLPILSTTGYWDILAGSKWNLNLAANEWTSCTIDNSSHISWSNLRFLSTTTLTKSPVFAVACQVTKSASLGSRKRVYRVIPDRNKHKHNNSNGKEDQFHHRARHVTVLPYSPTWVIAMTSLTDYDWRNDTCDWESSICRKNLARIKHQVTLPTSFKANANLRRMLYHVTDNNFQVCTECDVRAPRQCGCRY